VGPAYSEVKKLYSNEPDSVKLGRRNFLRGDERSEELDKVHGRLQFDPVRGSDFLDPSKRL